MSSSLPVTYGKYAIFSGYLIKIFFYVKTILIRQFVLKEKKGVFFMQNTVVLYMILNEFIVDIILVQNYGAM